MLSVMFYFMSIHSICVCGWMCVCVLQSETCLVQIPELDFEADMGTLGGKFTTVEGLLEDFKSQV